MLSQILCLLLSVLALLFFPGLGDANDQQNADYQQQSVLNPGDVDVPPGSPISNSIEFFIDLLRLNQYEAVVSDMSKCAGDSKCIETAKDIKAWLCVAEVCNGNGDYKKPTECFEGFSANNFSSEVVDQINDRICPFVETPGPKRRKALLSIVPSGGNDELGFVKAAAHIGAVTKSADLCIKRIRDFLGPYGPKWDFDWMNAISGCRILSGISTRNQEEKDFYTWFGVQRKFNCTGIMNPELRTACQTPTARSPKPTQEMSSLKDRKEYDSIKYLVDQLRLRMFTSPAGDVSYCQGNPRCIRDSKMITTWRCLANVCGGKNIQKEPMSCFGKDWGEFSQEAKDKINAMMCPHIKSPENASRNVLLDYLGGIQEEDLIEMEAYYLALQESAGSCQNYIKYFVGPYGPKWTPRWYRALSGCRLLTGESTFAYEQSDFYTWLGVERKFDCSNIVNSEMSAVCQTQGNYVTQRAP